MSGPEGTGSESSRPAFTQIPAATGSGIAPQIGPEIGPQIGPEDAKLVTLGRGARGRAGAAEGAAVRDVDGRTYAAATVRLKSFQLTALQAAVAAAIASGADELEAAVIVGAFDPGSSADPASVAAARELSTELLILATPDGAVQLRIRL